METSASTSKSTMLDSLPQQNDEGQQKLVQEILQEIKDDQPVDQNDLQQYQMDSNVNMTGPAGQLPSQDEIREMQEMQQMQQMQQMQEQQLLQEQSHLHDKSISFFDKIMSNSKETVLVAVLFLVLSQPFLNTVLSKIPKALSETGDCSIIGLSIKAILCALLYLTVKTFLLDK